MTVIDDTANRLADARDLYGQQFEADPFAVLGRLREQSPLYWDEVGEVWWLTRYQDVLEALLNAERFGSRYKSRQTRPVFGPNITQMEGQDHASRRRVVVGSLVGSSLDPIPQVVEEISRELLSHLSGRDTFDLVEDYTSQIPIRTIAAMLGLPREDFPKFHGWYRRMFVGICSREARPDGRRAQEEIGRYIAKIVDDRRLAPRDDIVSKIVTASQDGEGHPYTSEDIQGFVSHLLTAGGETTDSAMANMWSNLFDETEQLSAVREDPDLLDAAFTETLRHDSPVITTGREILQRIDIYGERLWPGENVHLSILSANNDPEVFKDPRKFNIFRDDLHMARELRNPARLLETKEHGHIAFGAGEHFCIGYQLARLEAVVAGRVLMETFPTLRPVDGTRRRHVVTPIVRAVREFPVRT